jgi:2-oxoglutarate ferredoxin oxidoreductase subunit alpha
MAREPDIESPESLSIAITGSGGSGAVTTGLAYLQAAARAGLYGLMNRSAGPQIRGGESAAMIRLGRAPVACMGDHYHYLVGLDWLNISRFTDEIPLNDSSCILTDPASGELPTSLTGAGARIVEVPLRELARTVEGGRLNIVALGALGALSGIPGDTMEEALAAVLGKKGSAVLTSSLACLRLGYEQTRAESTAPAPVAPAARWNISGNEACGVGALRGGVRFVAAYPITPASEMLEWLAPHLEDLGGSLLQAEDELASVNMIIGASFGGTAALTATSGPGLSLMMEGLGLAVASETPVTVVNVMRGGPSTGIPTKSEQSDLNIALYGFHGDAPHLVLAPLDIGDCVFTTEWAVRLAEHLQAVAIVLSDQALGQSRAVVPAPQTRAAPLERVVVEEPTGSYQRYALDDGDVSPMSTPGLAGGMYTADGLEHNEYGTPSSRAIDHGAQLEKRARKLAAFDYGADWADIEGDGEVCLLTWGSSSGAVREAAQRLRDAGRAARVIALRLLMPLQRTALQEALAEARETWVVEQNHGAQLFHYLASEQALPGNARSLSRPGPLPLRPGEIVAVISEA